jgi:hypothetical protein
MDQNELPFDPRHRGGPSGAANKISLLMVHLAQNMHLFDTEINTFSKQTKESFHLT